MEWNWEQIQRGLQQADGGIRHLEAQGISRDDALLMLVNGKHRFNLGDLVDDATVQEVKLDMETAAETETPA